MNILLLRPVTEMGDNGTFPLENAFSGAHFLCTLNFAQKMLLLCKPMKLLQEVEQTHLHMYGRDIS